MATKKKPRLHPVAHIVLDIEDRAQLGRSWSSMFKPERDEVTKLWTRFVDEHVAAEVSRAATCEALLYQLLEERKERGSAASFGLFFDSATPMIKRVLKVRR